MTDKFCDERDVFYEEGKDTEVDPVRAPVACAADAERLRCSDG